MSFLAPAERCEQRDALVKLWAECDVPLSLLEQELPWTVTSSDKEDVGAGGGAAAPPWERFLASFLHDEMVCEEWESMGLPRSLAESAAMALHSEQPICVDPHEQENRHRR